MENLENWREKIERGDKAEAARRLRVSVAHYKNSQKKSPDRWTPNEIAINKTVKEIVLERESTRQEFIQEAN